jgi:hypothetical protein
MSFSIEALMNVTVESLAGFCGLADGDSQDEDYKSLMLKRQVKPDFP